ncbi:hypothetical protein MMC17_001822 [Xylographa soralifera]|nr:hypothetical protein [Xylographa soralifera]
MPRTLGPPTAEEKYKRNNLQEHKARQEAITERHSSVKTIEVATAMSYIMWIKVVGAVSTILTGASTVFLFILGLTFALDHQSICILAIAAACLQAASVIVLMYLLCRTVREASYTRGHSREKSRRARQNADTLLGLGLSVLAGAASVGTFVWTKVLLPDLSELFLGQKASVILACSLILWILSAISQLIYYIMLLIRRTQPTLSALSAPIPLADDPLDPANDTRPGTSHTLRASPPASPRISPKRSSLRSSLTIAIRPTSSKTKLVSCQPSYPTSITTTRASTDSAFDSWDTSSISPQMRETVLRSSPALPRNPLSPIPGSRSPSPAKALEGPFLPSPPQTRPSTSRSQPSSPPPSFNNSYFTQQLLLSSHSQPTSPAVDSPATFFSFHNFSRPSVLRGRSSTESIHHIARARSASANAHPGIANEDHIHPLFRSNSPTPPPSATPGTIVTAAPGSFTGLLIHERMVRRMRSGSLPTSPSPLAVGTGYFFPEDMPVRSPSEGMDDGARPTGDDCTEEDDNEEMRRKIEEGMGRKMTPPIPDFILSVARSDSNTYGRRKIEGGEGALDKREDGS